MPQIKCTSKPWCNSTHAENIDRPQHSRSWRQPGGRSSWQIVAELRPTWSRDGGQMFVTLAGHTANAAKDSRSVIHGFLSADDARDLGQQLTDIALYSNDEYEFWQMQQQAVDLDPLAVF